MKGDPKLGRGTAIYQHQDVFATGQEAEHVGVLFRPRNRFDLATNLASA